MKCRSCKQEKPEDRFGLTSNGRTRKHTCIDCVVAHIQEIKSRNKRIRTKDYEQFIKDMKATSAERGNRID